MRYWDGDHPEWSTEEGAFAAAWRRQPMWVVSRSLKSVGPHATLVGDDPEAAIRGLKAQHVGEIEVGGPDLARSQTDVVLPMSIASTSTPSCWDAASPSSPAHGRRSASWPAI
jgi:hypothetical protein